VQGGEKSSRWFSQALPSDLPETGAGGGCREEPSVTSKRPKIAKEAPDSRFTTQFARSPLRSSPPPVEAKKRPKKVVAPKS